MSDFQRCLRLTDAKRKLMIERLLERVDASLARLDDPVEVLAKRALEAEVTVVQPGGSTGHFRVHAVPMGPGMVALHSSFLHPGTEWIVEGDDSENDNERVKGEVVWCEHLDGGVHGVAVRFDDELLGDFEEEFEADARTIDARMLLADEQPMDADLLRYHLRDTSIVMDHCASPAGALGLVAEHAYDVVVTELQIGPMEVEALIARLREAGFAGPVVVMTAETNPNRLRAAKAAGAAAVLLKPYDPEAMPALLARVVADGRRMIAESGGVGAAPIESSLVRSAETESLVERYVASVNKVAAELRDSTAEADFARVRSLCLVLKGSGRGHGFDLLSDLAEAAVRQLDASSSVSESAEQVSQLVTVCDRVTAWTSASDAHADEPPADDDHADPEPADGAPEATTPGKRSKKAAA